MNQSSKKCLEKKWRKVKWEELHMFIMYQTWMADSFLGFTQTGFTSRNQKTKISKGRCRQSCCRFPLQLIGQTHSSVTHWDKDLVNFSLGGCWVGVDLMISWRVPIRNHSLSLMMIWLTPHNEWMLSEINKHRYMNNEQLPLRVA